MWIIFAFCSIVIVLIASKIYFKGTQYNGVKPNLLGFYAIVTGGGNGIGQQVVKDLAQQGCQVIIADIVNSQKLAVVINKEIKAQRVFYQYIDLGNLQSIKEFVNKLKWHKIDFLVNNAGIMGLRTLTKTNSNFQAHFGINYIGHFYLTHLLWPILHNSNFFRIIILSSITHRRIGGFGKPTTIQFNNLNFEHGGYERELAYSRSKLCLTMFSKALSQIIDKDKGIVMTVHPGIARTGLVNNMFSRVQSIGMSIIFPLFWLFTKNCKQAAQTIFHVLYSDKQLLKSGQYYSDCAISPKNPLVEKHWKKMFEITKQLLKIEYCK